MEIKLIGIGKNKSPFIKAGVEHYQSRIERYTSFTTDFFPSPAKGQSGQQMKKKEGEALLKRVHEKDCMVLLDEQGKSFTSTEFAQFLQKKIHSQPYNTVFLAGGSYGVSKDVKTRADHIIALSSMTIAHQLVRLVFLEQLYRAFTIINRENYHH